MPDVPVDATVCSTSFQYWTCNATYGFIKCSSIPESCHASNECTDENSKPAKLNATYSSEGKFKSIINETECKPKYPSYNDCCTTLPGACDDYGCPQDLPLHIINFLFSSTSKLASTLGSIPFSATSAQGSVTSLSVPSTVPTTTSTGQPELYVNPIASSATDTPSLSFTGTLSPNPIDTPSLSFTATSSPNPIHTPAPRSNSTAIAGGVAGGIVGLALLIGLLTIYRRRRNARAQYDMDQRNTPAWGTGQSRPIQLDNAALEEIKQGPSPASPPLRPPSSPPSPLLSPLPPPPAYAPFRPHGNDMNRSPDQPHSSSGSPCLPYDLPSPESPPSPPPPITRISQHSTSNYSDEQSISPISSHYQHRPFDN